MLYRKNRYLYLFLFLSLYLSLSLSLYIYICIHIYIYLFLSLSLSLSLSNYKLLEVETKSIYLLLKSKLLDEGMYQKSNNMLLSPPPSDKKIKKDQTFFFFFKCDICLFYLECIVWFEVCQNQLSIMSAFRKCPPPPFRGISATKQLWLLLPLNWSREI